MKQTKPNILLINIDDLGWTDLSYMGSQFYESPRIDAFAREGKIFTSAYASAANCAPSRANMITGVYGDRHGVWTVGSSERGDSKLRRLVPAENKTSIPEGIPTIASKIKEMGYHTCMVGKWHVSENPLEYGFDENIGGSHAGHPGSYFAPYKNVHLENTPDGEYLPERLSNEVCSYLDRHTEAPFFLYYATYLVHTPLQGEDESIEKYKQKLQEGGGNDQHNNPVFAAMIEALDQSIGKVLDHLDKNGLSDNTLVILTSDNGGVFEISRQAPLRAGKGAYYEGGIRIPFTARWPNKIPAGTISNTPISNIDFFPTLLNIAGGNSSELELEGNDISASLFEKESEKPNLRELFWHFPIYLEAAAATESHDPIFRARPGSILRYGQWKLHHYYEDNAYELYNLTEDIGERNECSADNLKIFSQMKERLAKRLKKLNFHYEPIANPEFNLEFENEILEKYGALAKPLPTSEDEWYRVMKFID